MKLGVILFQLGGPDSPEAIEPFLYNLFCDPDIIDFPFARIARQPLARLISSRRAKHVAHHYAEIGGKSPILDYTTRQARALEAVLRQDCDARVAIAMRYWHPFTDEAIRQIPAFAPDEVVLLPLTRNIPRPLRQQSERMESRAFIRTAGIRGSMWSSSSMRTRLTSIRIVGTIRDSLAGFGDPADVDFVFSAHSVPVAVIEKGDPYQRQIERTTEIVWQRGGWPGASTSVIKARSAHRSG